MADSEMRSRWGIGETIAVVWILAALAGAVGATVLLRGTLPFFTFVWLFVPLGVLIATRNARQIGIRAVPWSLLLRTTGIAVALWWLLMLAFEPWTHIYRDLVQEAISSAQPDTTFGWLTRYPGATGWAGLVFYSGFVTLFGEELFFRGWLLQLFLRRMKPAWAIVLQAALFSLPQAVVMLLFPPLQAVVWIVVYSWLAVGVVGGWAAYRTRSIWPSLIAATLTNVLLTALVL